MDTMVQRRTGTQAGWGRGMKKGVFIWMAALFFVGFLQGCGPVTGFLADIGIGAGSADEGLTLAVTAPLISTDSQANYLREYIKGVELAAAEIAAWDMDAPLHIRIDYDDGDFGSAAELTQAYTADPTVIGVVGYWGSTVLAPLSNLYIAEQKTLIASIASVPSLTQNPSDYLLRNIPEDGQISKKMADYAKGQGIGRAVVYYEDSLYGFEMAVALEKYASAIGVDIVDKLCSPHTERELVDLERKWRAIGYEAIFLISTLDEGVAFLNTLDSLGFTGSVICSNGLDDAALPQYLMARETGFGELVVCSTLKHEQTKNTALMDDFIENYQARFGTPPDSWAALGYDSVIIAAKAVAYHDIKTTDQLSAYLRRTTDLGGLYENAVFDERGDIQGKPIYMKRLVGAYFEYID